MIEMAWKFTITRAGAIVATGTLTTIDPSFPVRALESLAAKYGACHMTVRDSYGQIWEKDWD